MENKNRKGFIHDMAWYLLGSAIPMGVGFFKTPVFTRYFTPEEYGYLGLVNITFSYISIFLYSWLASCMWRYYNAYKNKKQLDELYTNMLLIYLGAAAIMLGISVGWAYLAGQQLVKSLVILSFLFYFFKEIIGLYLIVIRLEGKAIRYNVIHSMRSVLSFGLLYLMTFQWGWRITAVLWSSIAIDFLVFIVIVVINSEKVRLSLKKISRKTLQVLFRFGSIGLVSNFFFLLITSSDRYIIALFANMDTVGIYNQVYNISQLSVVALITVYFNTINPRLNKELERDLNGSAVLMQDYLHAMFLFGLPLVTYLSLFPKQIAHILLGESFRSGYIIMPWIFLSGFMYGLFLLIEIRFKFADKLKSIAIGLFSASVINLILNFVLIPLWGYHWAAISTLLAYVFLLVFFYGQDGVGFFQNKTYMKNVGFYVFLLLIQVFADIIVRKFYFLNLWQTIVEGVVFVLIYFIVFRNKLLNIKIPY